MVSLIGTNGAGKTTTLRTISGLLRPIGGRDPVPGRADRADAGARHRRARAGALAGGPADLPPAVGRGEPAARCVRPRDPAGVRTDLDAAYDLFPILGERRKQPAGTFSGGEQQMLAMGRAMMSRPKLLMLDEPSMGLSPIMMKRIMSTVTELQRQGTTILLVEQNAQAALKRADYGYVLEVGKIVLSGTGPRPARQRRGPQGLPRRRLNPGPPFHGISPDCVRSPLVIRGENGAFHGISGSSARRCVGPLSGVNP